MAQVVPLFRSLMREGRAFMDYNFRSYAMRRIRLGFDQNRGAGASQLPELLEEGRSALLLLRRQSSVSRLFQNSDPSVMASTQASLKK
mmetsp:Transcript_29570/g.86269  ORF Transcript_29570/g.86269 Transcript_29570/m.86269 type:complete len:88 (+) Transcript_29570:91-354(+)